MFERRPDATLVRDLPAIRRFMPFLSPRRNESLVYFAHDVDVEAALRFVEAHAEERPPDRPLTLFHLILRALVRVLDERPRRIAPHSQVEPAPSKAPDRGVSSPAPPRRGTSGAPASGSSCHERRRERR